MRLSILAAAHRSHDADPQFTPREAEIVGLIGEGMSNKDIACQLGTLDANCRSRRWRNRTAFSLPMASGSSDNRGSCVASVDERHSWTFSTE
jgi:FixJ family two-component response regulator